MNPPTSDITVLVERIRVLEAESAIRLLLNRYMALCDVPGPDERADALAQLFCDDAVWQGLGSGYAAKFGRRVGREAIVAMLMGYLPPNRHFQFNAHFLSGEQITVDGHQAKGRWLMQQISRYDSGQAELIVAALNLEFIREAGAWLISSFTTERLEACSLENVQGAQA
ncbi:SnoaL-like domain-containing protein [Pseudomonas sp. NFACC02]|uniref:nuclear transport factor 2 family protein n=1 Tax=Pseudomonas sp. NFACC02 TaxID=1566250 RepID=UPI0008BC0AC5|nr:nuclear transport factor 2 family protein [Pseudomonas sp. NFACC02]SEQ62395.1 SnoaL-like domain-containing protein [Pseudomonas sp. NFACC02]